MWLWRRRGRVATVSPSPSPAMANSAARMRRSASRLRAIALSQLIVLRCAFVIRARVREVRGRWISAARACLPRKGGDRWSPSRPGFAGCFWWSLRDDPHPSFGPRPHKGEGGHWHQRFHLLIAMTEHDYMWTTSLPLVGRDTGWGYDEGRDAGGGLGFTANRRHPYEHHRRRFRQNEDLSLCPQAIGKQCVRDGGER